MRSLVMAIFLFQTALGNALSEAMLPLVSDPYLIWNYGVVCIVFRCITNHPDISIYRRASSPSSAGAASGCAIVILTRKSNSLTRLRIELRLMARLAMRKHRVVWWETKRLASNLPSMLSDGIDYRTNSSKYDYWRTSACLRVCYSCEAAEVLLVSTHLPFLDLARRHREVEPGGPQLSVQQSRGREQTG